MIRYYIIIEKAGNGGNGGYVPDLPGCIGMGESKEAVIENVAEAIKFHIEGLKLEGLPIPSATTEAESLMLEIA